MGSFIKDSGEVRNVALSAGPVFSWGGQAFSLQFLATGRVEDSLSREAPSLAPAQEVFQVVFTLLAKEGTTRKFDLTTHRFDAQGRAEIRTGLCTEKGG